MSIFIERHHDSLLLEYLSIDEIVVLSQVSKYYYNITKHILQPFREFHEIRHTLLPKTFVINDAVHVTIDNREPVNKLESIFLKNAQCYIYGNIDVIKYFDNNFERKLDVLVVTTVNKSENFYSHTWSKISLEYMVSILAFINKDSSILNCMHKNDYFIKSDMHDGQFRIFCDIIT